MKTNLLRVFADRDTADKPLKVLTHNFTVKERG